jgi:OOP family OmpA-OmpF porin
LLGVTFSQSNQQAALSRDRLTNVLEDAPMLIAKLLSLTALSFVLSACGTMSVQKLSEMVISPSDYRSHLASKYQTMVRFESEEMYDEIDAAHFAQKALGILSGDVEAVPEQPKNWRLTAPHRQPITSAYSRLQSALSLKTDRLEPETTAEAVAAFDCWVEQAEEGWQVEHIKNCKDRFSAAMDKIQSNLGLKIGESGAAKKVIVYFATDSAVVTSIDAAFLSAQVAQLAEPTKVEFLVEGHADRVGTERYNKGLSLRRAITVHGIITSSGMDTRQVGVAGRGELATSISTEDEEPEPRNRRVEIQIRWALKK